MPTNPDKKIGVVYNQMYGSIYGVATSDALGAPIEFNSPGTFPLVTGFRSGGPFNLAAGTWTDDTSLALCLAESPGECGGFNPTDQSLRYERWYREGHLSATGH